MGPWDLGTLGPSDQGPWDLGTLVFKAKVIGHRGVRQSRRRSIGPLRNRQNPIQTSCLGNKTPPVLFFVSFRMHFLIPFGIDFLSMFNPTWFPKYTKIPHRIGPETHSILASISDRFVAELSSQTRPPRTSTILVFHYQNPPFEINIEFWSNMCANLVNFCAPNPSKSIQKSIPKSITISINFHISKMPLGCHSDSLGCHWESTGMPLGCHWDALAGTLQYSY